MTAPKLLRQHSDVTTMTATFTRVPITLLFLAAACGWSAPVSAQAAAAAPAGSLDALTGQMRELREAVDAMREQLAGARRESAELRRELQATRAQLDALQGNAVPRLDVLAEQQDLLGAKVDDQEQTKVESGSKYHVRLSGLALLNAASTRGAVDNLDLPAAALPRGPGESAGSLGAGVRQSFVSFEVFGATLAGAKSAGAITVDFFGGFPPTTDGVSSPLLRMRTATMSLDWKNTSVVGGQDAPFFSPRSPTSLASTAYPALSSAGNLWTWTPQLHVEHRFAVAADSAVVVQAGILDPFTGELPPHEYIRSPTSGERSRLPAQAVRVGWQRFSGDRPAAIGLGGYHATQDWGFGRGVHAWAATADWNLPVGAWIAVSGELYRGQAISGLGGGLTSSVLFDGPSTLATSGVLPVATAGGWSQLKVKPVSRLEFNAAFGADSPFRTRLDSRLALGAFDRSALVRNANGSVNGIYQARSNLVLSVEYRRLWTATLGKATHIADHVSISTGIMF